MAGVTRATYGEGAAAPDQGQMLSARAEAPGNDAAVCLVATMLDETKRIDQANGISSFDSARVTNLTTSQTEQATALTCPTGEAHGCRHLK